MPDNQKKNFDGALDNTNAKLLQELDNCQIELEKQNENLRQTQIDLEECNFSLHDSNVYKDILATTLDGFLIIDADDGKLLEVNQRYSQLSGYTLEELRTMTLYELTPPELFADTAAQIQKITVESKAQFETIHRRKDGTLWFAEVSATYRILNGKWILYAFLRDISRRKQAENKLKASQQLVSSILDSLTSHIAVLDKKGDIIAVNKAWRQFAEQNALPADYKMLGCNYLDVCIKALQTTGGNEKIAEILHGLTGVLRGTLPSFQTEYPCHSAKDKRWFYMVVSPLQGEIGGAVVNHHNITERKTLEQAITESRNLFRTVIDTLPVRIFWKDRNCRILGCNMALAHDVNASSPKELIGKDVSQTIWAKYADIFHADDRAVMESGIAKLSYDEFVETEEGKAFWRRTSKVPFKNQAGEIIGLIGIYEDVTERKRMEQQLQDSEHKLATVFDILDAGVAITNEQGDMIDCNNRIASLLRLSKQEVLQRGYSGIVTQVIRPDFTPMPREEYASVRALESNTTVSHVELGFIKPDGEIAWLLVTAAPLHLKGHGVVITYIDITELKRQQQAIKDSESRFRSIIEISPVPMALTDAQQNITFLNPAFSQMFGYDLNDIPTLTDWWSKAYPDPEYRCWAETTWQKLLSNAGDKQAQKELAPTEAIVRCKNGTDKTVLANASILSNSFDEYLAILYDITAQKQAEAILREQLEHEVVSSHEELEKIKTESDKISTALDVVLNRRDNDPNNAKNRLSQEMNTVILPLFKKVKGLCNDRYQLGLIDVLEQHLQQLNQSYGTESALLPHDTEPLTPIEMQVALLIKQGLATKSIASMLGISPDTVCTHRKHIRKKLKLDGTSSNLRNHLMALLREQ